MPTGYAGGKEQVADEQEECIEKGKQGDYQAEFDHEPQGFGGMGKNMVLGHVQSHAKAVGGRTDFARCMNDVDLRPLVTDQGDQQAEGSIVLFVLQDGIDDRARIDAEIGDGIADLLIGQVIEYHVEQFRGQSGPCAILSICSSPYHDVVSLLRLAVELADFLGSILKVAIHDDTPIASHVIKAGGDGVMLPEITGKIDPSNAGLLPGQGLNDLPRVIGATIIDEDNLEGIRQLGQAMDQSMAQLAKVEFFSVDGRNNGNMRMHGNLGHQFSRSLTRINRFRLVVLSIISSMES